MEWNELLVSNRRRMHGTESKEPVGEESTVKEAQTDRIDYVSADYRTEFEKDYHRIIGSSGFRRLQDKTQVYSLDENDFIRTRLTHSLEVSSFGKSLGKSVGKKLCDKGKISIYQAIDISDILMCAGLIHDIGNPPFGHYGETAIQEWFREHEYIKDEYHLNDQMWEDFTHFEGNAQSLRIVSKLHHLIDLYGMNLTIALLNTIIKYPIPSNLVGKEPKDKPYKKYGYFLAEEETFREITHKTGAGDKRYPLMLLLEAADDIAYCTADIEDGIKKRFLSVNQLKESLKGICIDGIDMAEHLEEKLRLSINKPDGEISAVQNFMVTVQGKLIRSVVESFTETNYEAIMDGSFRGDLFKGTPAEKLVDILKSTAFTEIFNSSTIAKSELAANEIIYCFLDLMVPAVLKYGVVDENKPEKGLSEKEKRAVRLIPGQYNMVYQLESSKLKDKTADSRSAYKAYYRLLMVTDFVSGMTDHYAKNLYQEIVAAR